MSTSYPYLTVARETGEDYGDVLWYSDYLDVLVANEHILDRHLFVCLRFSAATKSMILTAHATETERRRCQSRS